MENGIYTRTGKRGAIGEELLFGAYPQSRVGDAALIAALDAAAGPRPSDGDAQAWTSYQYYIFDENEKDFMWYRDVFLDGEGYRGVYFTDCRPNDTMNTSEENRQEGNGYRPGTVYWFRYEPIRWQLLAEEDGRAWLLADTCLDAQAYRNVVWQNSYVKSSIRAWLNGEFLETAFSAREREAIFRATVENNMEDEDISDGDIPGSDTHDLIHLLSEDEAAERLLPDALACGATDYARAQGCYVYEAGNAPWWLRTPYYSVESWACTVCANGLCSFNSGDITATDTGVRPALWLTL